jgi:hypothetical protein
VADAVYEVVMRSRSGHDHRQEYDSSEPLEVGMLVSLRGQRWLVDSVARSDRGKPRATLTPACYRLVLRHPDGREQAGAFRRFRAAEPRLGHAFTTLVNGQPVSWQIVDERIARGSRNELYIEFVAERDYAEVEAEALPDHELEHLDAAGATDTVNAALVGGGDPGTSLELVALERGAEPDWPEAAVYIDSLVLEELGDDLLELCGIDSERNPRDRWLELVRERLRSDLELFRADVEGDHDEIEEWDSDGARVFASVGTWEDEASPTKGHGWMVRLVDSGALAAARFRRVRKADLLEPA